MKPLALVSLSVALAVLPTLTLAQTPAPKAMATHHAMSSSMSHSSMTHSSMSHSMAHASPKPTHSSMSHSMMSHDSTMTHASPKP